MVAVKGVIQPELLAVDVSALQIGKQVVKAALIESGYEAETVNAISDSLSWGATCNNLVIIGGGSGGLGLAAGLVCLAVTWDVDQ